jgi:hypothetical protein
MPTTIEPRRVTEAQVAAVLRRIEANLKSAAEASSAAMRCAYAFAANGAIGSLYLLDLISDRQYYDLSDRAEAAMNEPAAPLLRLGPGGDFSRDIG